MNCDAVRQHLADWVRDRLDAETTAAMDAHLAGCPECRRAEAAERDLETLLRERMPRHAAPAHLIARLSRRQKARWRRALTPLTAAAALVLAALALFRPASGPGGSASARMLDEAVGDHLR